MQTSYYGTSKTIKTEWGLIDTSNLILVQLILISQIVYTNHSFLLVPLILGFISAVGKNKLQNWLRFTLRRRDAVRPILRQSNRESQICSKNRLFIILLCLCIITFFFPFIRTFYLWSSSRSPFGTLTPDLQYAIGFINHIVNYGNTSSFNATGVTLDFYTGIYTFVALIVSLLSLENSILIVICAVNILLS